MRRIYIHQKDGWPDLHWEESALVDLLVRVRHKQGKLCGFMDALGFRTRDEAGLETATEDVIKTSEIEGERLDLAQVRSSVARKLGLDIAGLVPSDRHVDGVVEMTLDATRNFHKPLTRSRLFGWHAALFPSGRSTMHRITVGAWRKPGSGPMQVVSGAMGKEKVHFEAPPSARVDAEMRVFLRWINEKKAPDPVLKSGVAHFWFITIHPFDDGNGRIARAIGDMLLAGADGSSRRYYSMTAQVQLERKRYYEVLETCQKGDMDITAWLTWYLQCLDRALDRAFSKLQTVIDRVKFWDRHAETELNERQRKLLGRLLDGFTGNLTSSKWAKIAKCSDDTALRDIQDLVSRKILVKGKAGGRSTAYSLRKT